MQSITVEAVAKAGGHAQSLCGSPRFHSRRRLAFLPEFRRGETRPLAKTAVVSFLYRMRKKAISISLEADNLAWLRGRALATGRLSVSAMLDRVIREARSGATGSSTAIRSIVGTIEIGREDPELRTADMAVRVLVAKSLIGRETRRRAARDRAARARTRPGGRRTV